MAHASLGPDYSTVVHAHRASGILSGRENEGNLASDDVTCLFAQSIEEFILFWDSPVFLRVCSLSFTVSIILSASSTLMHCIVMTAAGGAVGIPYALELSCIADLEQSVIILCHCQ